MKLKKITTLFLAGIMILSAMTACGKDNSGTADIGTDGTSAVTDNTVNSPEERYIYERVVLIGLDGAGNFFQYTDTPNMDKIFAEGATTNTAITSEPSISAQGWGAMLTGASPVVHGLTNAIIATNPYENEIAPSVFKRIVSADPDAVIGHFSTWDALYGGIVEPDIDGNVHYESGSDSEIADKAAAYLKENDPDFLFLSFGAPDHVGHENGYGRKDHLACLTEVDGYIGTVYDALEENGLLDGTLILLTTDHGGTTTGLHGGTNEEEMQIFFGAAGESVKKGEIGDMNVRDTTAIILYGLGIDVPEFDVNGFSAQVPANLFEEYTPSEWHDINGEILSHETVPTPAKGSGKYLTDFLDADKLETVLHFDENASDAMGTYTPVEVDAPKYYSSGYNGPCIEVGEQGYVQIPDLDVGKESFSIGMWLYLDSATTTDQALYGTNEMWENDFSRIAKGFCMAYRGWNLNFRATFRGTPDSFDYPHPTEISKGWVHTLLVVDREAQTVTHYYNFADSVTNPLGDVVKTGNFSNATFTIGEDGMNTSNNDFNYMIDDFIFYRGAMAEDEVAKLAEYYNYTK